MYTTIGHHVVCAWETRFKRDSSTRVLTLLSQPSCRHNRARLGDPPQHCGRGRTWAVLPPQRQRAIDSTPGRQVGQHPAGRQDAGAGEGLRNGSAVWVALFTACLDDGALGV
jgi:hypothetical protein